MLLELIAIIAAGFGLAGIALSLNIALRRRLPQWIVPAAAGAGMLLMAVWLEYSWLERSEEHTSELQSLMRISYAVFCLKKKKNNTISNTCTRLTTSRHE